LAFGCVFAQFGFPSPAIQVPNRDVRFTQSSQGAAAMLLRSNLAKSQKSSLRVVTQFLERLYRFLRAADLSAMAWRFFWAALSATACFCEFIFWFDFGDLSPMMFYLSSKVDWPAGYQKPFHAYAQRCLVSMDPEGAG
jgi:hypothetical protein